MVRFLTAVTFALVFADVHARGAITPYYDKQTWEDAVGSHTTITFQEFPIGTWVSDHYADLGITFDFNADFHSQIQPNASFLNDGVGLVSFGLSGWPIVRFSTPTYAIALESPAPANFFLYYQGISVGNTTIGGGYFKGITSTLPFDTVLAMPTGIDDLYFGPPIPAPGALMAIAVAAGAARRRCCGG